MSLTSTFAGPSEAQALNFIPPDPSLAVGPDNVVVTMNDAIAWYDRAGNLEALKFLDSFFNTGIGHQDYDPRVVYDQYSGHFYATADFTDFRTHQSRIYIAESVSDDLSAGWKTPVFLNVLINANFSQFWGDYPTLSVDEFGVYVTVNYFDFNENQPDGVAGGSTSRLYIANKNLGFYSLPGYDPGSSAGAGALDGVTLQPARIYGNEAAFGLTGDLLVAYRQGTGDGTLYLIQVDNAGATGSSFSPVAIDVGNLSDLAIPANFAPEPGAISGVSGIDVGDNRVYSAVWRDGVLYATTEINLNGRAVVHWFEVNTSTMTLVDQGNVTANDLGSGINTYYGTIAVSAEGAIAIEFSASGPNLDPGAYVATRLPGDPAGQLGPSQVLHTGQAPYFAYDDNGDNRWGDYSGAVVDPVDDRSFWFFNEYASSTANQWQTQGGDLISQPASAFQVSSPLMTSASGSLEYDQVVNGQMVYATIGGIGPEWELDGNGFLLGDGQPGFLMRNTGTVTTGALEVGEVVNGSVAFTRIGGVGPEWQFEGNDDFLNDGQSQFLIRNTGTVIPGTLVLGEVKAGAAVYTKIGGVGVEWEFDGDGDFLGDGRQGFLIRNDGNVIGGALYVGEVGNGAASFTRIGGVGPEWQFEGTGDFLGDGHTAFLMRNNGPVIPGALEVGEIRNGSLSFSQIGGVGPEWEFVGSGHYLSTTKDDFLLRNTGSVIGGRLLIGTVSNGAAQFTAVGGVASEWNFHTGNTAVLA